MVDVVLDCSPPYLWKQSLSAEPRTCLVSLGWLASLLWGIYHIARIRSGYQAYLQKPSFYVASGDLNAGPPPLYGKHFTC